MKMDLMELIELGMVDYVFSDGFAMIRKEREEDDCDILDSLCDCINLND